MILNSTFSDHNNSILENDDTTQYDSDDSIVSAPIIQELNHKPTVQPYKLTFYYQNEKHDKDHLSDNDNHHGNYDGLVVQSYDNSLEGSKVGR